MERLASQLRGESGPEAQAAAEDALKGFNSDSLSNLRQEIEEQEREFDAMPSAEQATVAELQSIIDATAQQRSRRSTARASKRSYVRAAYRPTCASTGRRFSALPSSTTMVMSRK